MSNRPNLGRGLLIGATAGIAATLVMDQFQKFATAGQRAIEKQKKLAEGESKWAIAHERVAQEQREQHQEDSTEKVARHISQAIGTQLPDDQKRHAGQAVHYAFGTLMGAVYGVAAELAPEVTTGGGTAFGTLLFLGADEVAVPAFKLSPPPNMTPAGAHLQHWAAHVVYGGTLELTRNLLRRLA